MWLKLRSPRGRCRGRGAGMTRDGAGRGGGPPIMAPDAAARRALTAAVAAPHVKPNCAPRVGARAHIRKEKCDLCGRKN